MTYFFYETFSKTFIWIVSADQCCWAYCFYVPVLRCKKCQVRNIGEELTTRVPWRSLLFSKQVCFPRTVRLFFPLENRRHFPQERRTSNCNKQPAVASLQSQLPTPTEQHCHRYKQHLGIMYFLPVKYIARHHSIINERNFPTGKCMICTQWIGSVRTITALWHCWNGFCKYRKVENHCCTSALFLKRLHQDFNGSYLKKKKQGYQKMNSNGFS